MWHGAQTDHYEKLSIKARRGRRRRGGDRGREKSAAYDIASCVHGPDDFEARHLNGHTGDAVVHEALRYRIRERTYSVAVTVTYLVRSLRTDEQMNSEKDGETERERHNKHKKNIFHL